MRVIFCISLQTFSKKLYDASTKKRIRVRCFTFKSFPVSQNVKMLKDENALVLEYLHAVVSVNGYEKIIS